MVHLARACIDCDRVWLVTGPSWTCPHCSRPAEVVPGESYRPTDSELFQRIESAMHGRLSSLNVSHRLCASLSDVYARSHRPGRLLGSLIEAVPELQFVQSELSRDPARITRALGMMLIVLTAHLRALEARGAKQRAAPPSPGSL